MRYELGHAEPTKFPDETDHNDELFDALSNPRRRFLISLLDERSKPMAMADAAAELTKWEYDAPEDHIPKEQVQPRYVALHHAHVPKMADYGILAHDVERNTITLTDRGEGITAHVACSLE